MFLVYISNSYDGALNSDLMIKSYTHIAIIFLSNNQRYRLRSNLYGTGSSWNHVVHLLLNSICRQF